MSPITFKGSPGSPYTRKMLALMRYRRLGYRMLIGSRDTDFGLPLPKVSLLPTFYLKNEEGELEAVTDSTPLIRRFEAQASERGVVPTSPAARFLDELIEDYADEWLTKAMFHYRWSYDQDIRKAAKILPYWADISASQDKIGRRQEEFAKRQISRLYVVGSNSATATIIEGSYERFLQVMEKILEQRPFLLGTRPSACDFAVYGQLTQLTHFDPTPADIALDLSPRVYAWVNLIDDLSGLEPDQDGWITLTRQATLLEDLLTEIGRTYVPVMLANLEAIETGLNTVEVMVDDIPWIQDPFPYQAKCVRWLRESYEALETSDREELSALLDRSGCDKLFAG